MSTRILSTRILSTRILLTFWDRYENFEIYKKNPNVGHSKSGFAYSFLVSLKKIIPSFLSDKNGPFPVGQMHNFRFENSIDFSPL